MQTVFFTVQEGAIRFEMSHGGSATIDAAGICYAENDVGDALIDQGADVDDCFICSSDVDYCEEEGFEPGEARVIIERAIEDLRKTLDTH